MLQPVRLLSANHEALFIERYDRLMSWALQLTEQEREMAEDLLHDAFIQFTLTPPDLQSVRQLDNYLYGILRNLHLSQVRRATRRRFQQLSIIDYESAEAGLRSLDSRSQVQTQDELRRICHYACRRKEQSRSGSVLILRFFHGYYPSEIMQVLRCSRHAVDLQLAKARAEVKAILESPAQVKLMRDERVQEVLPTGFARLPGDFLEELRTATIFRNRRGECLESKALKRLYSREHTEPIGCADLAHIVSCPTCLDRVNRLLGLPLLAERYPPDSMGNDRGGKGSGGSGGGGANRGEVARSVTRWKRDARDAFEHRPQELCVSVNGYLQASQRISSEKMNLSLIVDLSEEIRFVEVFSEQGVRLSLLKVNEMPPEGPGEQSLRTELSDQRTLELALRFSSPWPTLEVAYCDPPFQLMEAAARLPENKLFLPRSDDANVEVVRDSGFHARRSLRSLAHSVKRLFTPTFWFRPATITVVFAVLLVAAFLLMQFRRVPVSPLLAEALLQRSAAAESALASRVDTVLHRTIKLEVSVPGAVATGSLTRRQIEIWQSAERGIIARRLYDERHALLAGAWRRRDGVQTFYQHGSRPQLMLTPQKSINGSAPLNFENVWHLDLSAQEFADLIGAEAAQVQELPNQYVVSYSRQRDVNGDGLVKATLTLSRSDFHAIEQTLLIRQGSETREFHFVETSFERHAPATVAPSVFEPEIELLNNEGDKKNSEAAETTGLPVTPMNVPVVATPELEVEVLRLLSAIGADLGEQVSVVRAPEGFLHVQAIVDSEKRKHELQAALAGVSNNSAVKLDIATRDEAISRQQRSGAKTQRVTVAEAAPASNAIPVDAELRRYFSASGLTGEQLELNISRFSNRALNHSLQIMQHAWAIKRLTERFSPDELQALDTNAKSKWLAMIRGHAQALQQQVAMLQRELAPVFPADGGEVQSNSQISNDRELVQATDRLFALCSESDRVVGAAFTISPDATRGAAIKSAEFWRSLKSAESFAAKISRQ